MRRAEVGEEISSSEIARLAQKKPATVSNWRRRHEDFPQPVGGTAARPLFSRKEIVAWLTARGELSVGSDIEDIRRDAAAMDLPMAQALGAWYHLADSATAARLGVQRLPERLTPTKISQRPNYVAGYEELRHLLASYPAPYPEVGRILAEKPHVTDMYAPVAKTWANIGTQPLSGLAGLVLELASLRGTERVLDLAAGRADFLRAVAKASPGTDARGFESDPVAVSEALMLAARDGVRLELSVMDPFGREAAAPAEADVVFANGVWGEPLELSRLVGDPRFPEPIGVRQRDWAWAYLVVHHLSPTGRGFLTLPVTALGQGNAKGWRNLVLQGCVEAVIALPAGLHPGTHQSFQTCLLVLRKPSTDPSAGVLMMSAEKSSLDKTDQAGRQLATAYQAWRSGGAGAAPGSDVAVVPITTLARNKATLVPRR